MGIGESNDKGVYVRDDAECADSEHEEDVNCQYSPFLLPGRI